MLFQNIPSNKRIPILWGSRFWEDRVKFAQKTILKQTKPTASQTSSATALCYPTSVQKARNSFLFLFYLIPQDREEHQTLLSAITNGEELIVCSSVEALEYY